MCNKLLTLVAWPLSLATTSIWVSCESYHISFGYSHCWAQDTRNSSTDICYSWRGCYHFIAPNLHLYFQLFCKKDAPTQTWGLSLCQRAFYVRDDCCIHFSSSKRDRNLWESYSELGDKHSANCKAAHKAALALQAKHDNFLKIVQSVHYKSPADQEWQIDKHVLRKLDATAHSK